MSQALQDKYNILLKEKGFAKLETFLKIAVNRAEEFFIEINPEENSMKLNCIDPSHISNITMSLENENNEDFDINNLNSILQFNLRSSDLYKILTLNADKEIRIIPDIDEKNNFDMLKFVISQNNVIEKEIFVPIMEATNEDLHQGTTSMVKGLLDANSVLVVKIELAFLMETLKESEIFNNERLRFNIKVNGQTIEKFNIETFDNETDKTRRVKNHMFEGLHFGRVKLNNDEVNEFQFKLLTSFADLKKLLVTSKIYTNVNLILAERSPVCIIYNIGNEPDNATSLKALLAPIVIEAEDPIPN